MRHLIVRADGNGHIGLGHILRTLSVADELARIGVRTTYLCREVTPWVAQLLETRGHELHRLGLPHDTCQTGDGEATAAVIKANGVDTVLLDHYDLTGAWTDVLKSSTGCRIAAFDDMAIAPRCVDILIDTSPGRVESEYRALVPEDAVCLTGPTFAPLRPEFALLRQTHKPVHTGPVRVVISMGGADPTGMSITCLTALDGRRDITLKVILSSAAPMLEATKERVAQMTTPTKLLLDRTDMATILAEADLVIGGGGTSALERCAMRVPAVLAVLADNQIHNAAQLAVAGAAVVLPNLDAPAVRKTVAPLLEDAGLRARIGNAAGKLCDGLGAPRVAKSMLGRSCAVTLRAATPDDVTQVLALQSEPNARQFARTRDVPAPDVHAAWYAARLTRSDRDPFYIVGLNGADCGFVRLDSLPEKEAHEVSILIRQSARGQGVGWNALGLLRLTHPKRNIVAHVHPDNASSQNLFERAGYHRTAVDEFMSVGWASIAERQRDEN